MAGYVKLDEIVEYANELVGLHEFKDYGPMGLQYRGKPEVSSIACGVSVSEELIQKAIDTEADLLIVHHGLFWNNEPRYIDARMAKRLAMLEANEISLLAYHLCLDAQPYFGNNIAALDQFEGEIRKFGDIGWGKKLNRPYKRIHLEEWPGVKYLNGPTQIRKVAAIVGGAPHYIHDAVREGYDLFITGEAAEPTQALAKELGINFVALGHYNSEKQGVRNLTGRLGLEFDLPTAFLDVPNEV
jgi:dinuclear metal center YbgI/SA1388 family protein